MRRCLTLILVCVLLLAHLCSHPVKAQTASDASPTTNQIKSNLKEILNQSEFQPESSQPGPITEAVEKVKSQLQIWWKNIEDFFGRLFRGTGGGMGSVNVGLSYTLIAILSLIAVWIIVRVLSNQGGLRHKKQAGTRTIAAHQAEEEPPLAPDDWIEQAGRYARASDFRAAFRAVFLAILVQLDRTGEIEYRHSLTNEDYVRVLRTHDPRTLYELFASLAREFDRQWYGGRPAHESDYQRCLDVYHKLPDMIAGSLNTSPSSAPDKESRMAPGRS